MNNPFENIRQVRKHLLGVVSGLSVEQFNKIPEGFNNNIIWNLAHLISAQQSICYLLSNLKPTVDKDFVKTYLPGTKPEKVLGFDEIDTVKTLLITMIDQFEKDYQNKLFKEYQSRPTRYGVTLNNIDDALEFLLFHEGLHTGYIWALKRCVGKDYQNRKGR